MVPVSGVHEYPFVVVSNERVADQVFRMVISAPKLAAALEPGQFVNVRVPGNDAHLLRVPLSFASADGREGTIEFVYATVGDATRRMTAMRELQSSSVLGPCGHGWREPSQKGRVLLVAGGIGVTPVVAAGRWLAGMGYDFDAVVGAQAASRLWGIDELRQLGRGQVAVTTDDGSEGLRGFTTDAMRQLLEAHDYVEVMTCGPNIMMAGVARLAEQAGVPCQTSLERMMGCGFGACNTCNVALRNGGYASCCKDGPVFDSREVAW